MTNKCQHHTQWAVTTRVLLKIGNKSGMPMFTSLFQHSTGCPNTEIRKKEEIKGIQIGEEEVKLSFFADNMILYIQNPKESTKKLLELINEFSKVAGEKLIFRNLLHFYMPVMN